MTGVSQTSGADPEKTSSSALDAESGKPGSSALDADWPAICRRVVKVQRSLFEATADRESRTRYDGVGEGGDHTLILDRQCEDAVFAELGKLDDEGISFTAISEERGRVDFNGGGDTWVVIDPIDGSLNVRRTIPAHSLSIAVASGPDMASVEFGFVHDFGPEEEFWAQRGEGAWLDQEPIAATSKPEKIEILGIEGAKPSHLKPIVEELGDSFYRLRCVGSLAITLAYVANGRFDAMIGSGTCRSVDVAAAQLIAREAGASVAFGEAPLPEIGLDLDRRYPIVASGHADHLPLLIRAHAASG